MFVTIQAEGEVMETPSAGVQIRMYYALWYWGPKDLKLKASSKQKNILMLESVYKGRGGSLSSIYSKSLNQ